MPLEKNLKTFLDYPLPLQSLIKWYFRTKHKSSVKYRPVKSILEIRIKQLLGQLMVTPEFVSILLI
jgi:hypothetical protein